MLKHALTTARECHDHDLHDAAAIIASTGIRPRELATLAWHDVELSKGYLLIRPAKSGICRCVPFGPGVHQFLVARHERAMTEAVLGANASLRLGAAAQRLRQFGMRWYGRPIYLMELRHLFVALWFCSGGSAQLLMQVLHGHTSTPWRRLSSTDIEFQIIAAQQAKVEARLLPAPHQPSSDIHAAKASLSHEHDR